MDWQPLKTAPKDGTQVLLASVDDGGYGVRQGYYETAFADRRWYDIDPGKWLIWSLQWVGLTYDLKRVSDAEFNARVLRSAG